MNTGYRAILAGALLPILLTACTEEAPLPPPESRPVKTMLVGGDIAGDFRQFPGVVDAIQRHRSIRQYRPDSVPDELLQQIQSFLMIQE